MKQRQKTPSLEGSDRASSYNDQPNRLTVFRRAHERGMADFRLPPGSGQAIGNALTALKPDSFLRFCIWIYVMARLGANYYKIPATETVSTVNSGAGSTPIPANTPIPVATGMDGTVLYSTPTPAPHAATQVPIPKVHGFWERADFALSQTLKEVVWFGSGVFAWTSHIASIPVIGLLLVGGAFTGLKVLFGTRRSGFGEWTEEVLGNSLLGSYLAFFAKNLHDATNSFPNTTNGYVVLTPTLMGNFMSSAWNAGGDLINSVMSLGPLAVVGIVLSGIALVVNRVTSRFAGGHQRQSREEEPDF